MEPSYSMSSKLLVAIRDNVAYSEPGIGKPWMSGRLSAGAKVWYAAIHVWDGWFRGANDPKKIRILSDLLDAHIYDAHILKAFRHYQWDDKLESKVLPIAEDKNNSMGLRDSAYLVLIQRCGSRYISHLLNYIESSMGHYVDRANPVDHYCNLFNVGNRFFEYPVRIQERIIELGFSILEVESKGRLHFGYFIATRLGYFLKIPDDFKPNQRDAKYQENGGLKDSFFIDTVKNALEWNRQRKVQQGSGEQSD